MNPESPGSATAEARPSLAMVKYWGKTDSAKNIPATPSLALTLDGLVTTTKVDISDSEDRVSIEGVVQDSRRFEPFFSSLRNLAREYRENVDSIGFQAVSSSNFPTAAGLASSASGFAALAMAATGALGIDASDSELSSLARQGSASAARSIWGGFVRLDAGAVNAEPVHDEDWWPEIRVLVIQTSSARKKIGSREAMENTRRSSPYYQAWLEDAPVLMERALEALENRSLAALGPVMRMSYFRMFSTMFSAEPPISYWNPASLEIIALCEQIRAEGLSAWETMDAGPQVKVFCLSNEIDVIEERLREIRSVRIRRARPGAAPRQLF